MSGYLLNKHKSKGNSLWIQDNGQDMDGKDEWYNRENIIMTVLSKDNSMGQNSAIRCYIGRLRAKKTEILKEKHST